MRTHTIRNVTGPGRVYFLIMSLSFCFTLSLLTFLLFPGFLLGQVGQKVQWWLRLWWCELAISAGVTGWATAPVRLHLRSQVVLTSLGLAQGKLVAVVQHVLEHLRKENAGGSEKKKGKKKKSTDELLRWNKTASAGFLMGIQTWETPLVHGSLLRMFCLLAQAQCALMPNFSLSMCMAFTRSVKTATQHRKSLRVTFHIQEMCIRAVERRGGRAKRRSVGRGSVLLNSACAYTSKALNYAISALCQVCLELHNSPLFQTRRVPTMRKGMCLYGFSLRKEGSSWGIRLWSGDECVTLA